MKLSIISLTVACIFLASSVAKGEDAAGSLRAGTEMERQLAEGGKVSWTSYEDLAEARRTGSLVQASQRARHAKGGTFGSTKSPKSDSMKTKKSDSNKTRKSDKAKKSSKSSSVAGLFTVASPVFPIVQFTENVIPFADLPAALAGTNVTFTMSLLGDFGINFEDASTRFINETDFFDIFAPNPNATTHDLDCNMVPYENSVTIMASTFNDNLEAGNVTFVVEYDEEVGDFCDENSIQVNLTYYVSP